MKLSIFALMNYTWHKFPDYGKCFVPTSDWVNTLWMLSQHPFLIFETVTETANDFNPFTICPIRYSTPKSIKTIQSKPW